MEHVLSYDIAKDGIKIKMATINLRKCEKLHISGCNQHRNIIQGSKYTFLRSGNSDLPFMKSFAAAILNFDEITGEGCSNYSYKVKHCASFD